MRKLPAYIMMMLVISLPFTFAETLPTPSEQCIADHTEEEWYVDALDNGIIQALEAIFAAMYAVATIVNTIDSVILTISTIIGHEGYTGATSCCVSIFGELGACQSTKGVYSSWQTVKNAGGSVLQGIIATASCACCSNKDSTSDSGGGPPIPEWSDYSSGIGGACPLGSLANDWGQILYDDDDLPAEVGSGTSGISQFHMSAFDNIWVAIGCLCPTAILHHLRKLKTLYKVHSCCIEESCTTGMSLASTCDRQLDEALCMHFDGQQQLYKLIASQLANYIASRAWEEVDSYLKEKKMGHVASCALVLLQISKLPGKIKAMMNAASWFTQTIKDVDCEELGFEDVQESLGSGIFGEDYGVRQTSLYANEYGLHSLEEDEEPLVSDAVAGGVAAVSSAGAGGASPKQFNPKDVNIVQNKERIQTSPEVYETVNIAQVFYENQQGETQQLDIREGSRLYTEIINGNQQVAERIAQAAYLGVVTKENLDQIIELDELDDTISTFPNTDENGYKEFTAVDFSGKEPVIIHTSEGQTTTVPLEVIEALKGAPITTINHDTIVAGDRTVTVTKDGETSSFAISKEGQNTVSYSISPFATTIVDFQEGQVMQETVTFPDGTKEITSYDGGKPSYSELFDPEGSFLARTGGSGVTLRLNQEGGVSAKMDDIPIDWIDIDEASVSVKDSLSLYELQTAYSLVTGKIILDYPTEDQMRAEITAVIQQELDTFQERQIAVLMEAEERVIAQAIADQPITREQRQIERTNRELEKLKSDIVTETKKLELLREFQFPDEENEQTVIAFIDLEEEGIIVDLQDGTFVMQKEGEFIYTDRNGNDLLKEKEFNDDQRAAIAGAKNRYLDQKAEVTIRQESIRMRENLQTINQEMVRLQVQFQEDPTQENQDKINKLTAEQARLSREIAEDTEEERTLKILWQQQGDQIAYDLTWEVLNIALEEWAYPFIDDMCIEEGTYSEPMFDQPQRHTQGSEPPVEEDQIPPACDGVTGSDIPFIMNAPMKKDGDNYELSYSITDCREERTLITYRVNLRSPTRADIHIASGNLGGFGHQASDKIDDVAQQDYVPCIEINDASYCFPTA